MLVLEVARVHWKNLSKRVNILRDKIELLIVAGGGAYCYHGDLRVHHFLASFILVLI